MKEQMKLLLRQIISNTNEIVAATRPTALIIKAKRRYVDIMYIKCFYQVQHVLA